MKILCTADWRGASPKPVLEIVDKEKPDLVLYSGDYCICRSFGFIGIEDEIQLYKRGDASVALFPRTLDDSAISMLAQMFLKRSKTRWNILVSHGVLINELEPSEDSRGDLFSPAWANGWDLCILGGNPTPQQIGNIIVPGSIGKTVSEHGLPYFPRKGVWIWENGETRFVEFTRPKKRKRIIGGLFKG